jgi:hypothetical protein
VTQTRPQPNLEPVEASARPSSDPTSQRYGSAARGPVAYLAFWMVVWLVQWWLVPTWLVGSRSGLQTALQVLPAVVVAIFVLVLGSLFVLGQQAVTLHGARAALVLPLNPRVQAVVWRPLLITAVALLLSGQVPDRGEPYHAVTAAVATLVLATIGVLTYSATSLQALYSEFTAPVVFAQQVLAACNATSGAATPASWCSGRVCSRRCSGRPYSAGTAGRSPRL